MLMTMMATPNINKVLLDLNKEDRLLRWLLVKHCYMKYELQSLKEDDGELKLNKLPEGNIYDDEDIDEDRNDGEDEYNENPENGREH